MGKTRSSLGRFCRKLTVRKKRSLSVVPRSTIFSIRSNAKRKFEITPIKSPFKSPFLSEKDGLDTVMLNFFQMVADGTYPLDNIAFLLWTEVVKWHQCSNTPGMRYSRQTKLFWKLGWQLFGKRFVNFMGVFKSHGAVVLHLTDKGTYKPDASDINFAVPDTSVLRDFDPYDYTGERKPGIYADIIRTLSESLVERSVCITFDGKKIKQGLTEGAGDVDLLRHEKGMSFRGEDVRWFLANTK